MTQNAQYIVTAVFGLLLCSCAKDESAVPVDSRKETYPVRGTVQVDGRPANKVFVRCHDVHQMDKQPAHQTLGLTDESGKLEFSTYQSGDGVPDGEYVLTFTWEEWDDYWKRFSGADKLKGRYADPKTSEVRLTVKKGQLAELGVIELSTQ